MQSLVSPLLNLKDVIREVSLQHSSSRYVEEVLFEIYIFRLQNQMI